jgi:transcriptional regulator with XRE-family HTH domain
VPEQLPDPLPVIAANIKRLREARGLKQHEVADGADMGQDGREIRMLESGERDPGVRVFARVAKGLGVHPTELWEGFDPDQES